ncbi:hypothetical protein KGM_215084 [Danaus plexippus plexippus]|uniref:Uncharacterized protein n=1 Tax=Danaus plexippus plexippus TaxID=278856 RepID=A0A212F4D5_DANPL|nr:hypothetical protein KGM_215084 [Danaus plexippus plexippus]
MDTRGILYNCKMIVIEDEDDVLDDPIRLWDSDERAVFCSYRFKNTSTHLLRDRRERLKELLTRSQDTLDPPENLTFSSSNRPKCRPCSVQVVDCHKYPHFYEREYNTKSRTVTLEEDIILRDGLENIRQYSFPKEDVEYTQNESKTKEKFDTVESISFSGCKKFVNQEIYYDNQTLDLQAKRTKVQTMEVDQGLGQFNNADQTFNSSEIFRI